MDEQLENELQLQLETDEQLETELQLQLETEEQLTEHESCEWPQLWHASSRDDMPGRTATPPNATDRCRRKALRSVKLLIMVAVLLPLWRRPTRCQHSHVLDQGVAGTCIRRMRPVAGCVSMRRILIQSSSSALLPQIFQLARPHHRSPELHCPGLQGDFFWKKLVDSNRRDAEPNGACPAPRGRGGFVGETRLWWFSGVGRKGEDLVRKNGQIRGVVPIAGSLRRLGCGCRKWIWTTRFATAFT